MKSLPAGLGPRAVMRSPSFRNVLYVGAVQLVILLIPLLTAPWVLRALRPDMYGKYALALALVQYGVILVDFGFYWTATRHIAQIRDDRTELTRYFWTVQTARFLLAIGGTILIMSVVIAIPKFWPLIGIAAANLPSLFGTLLNPQWLFLGLERIRIISIADISARLLSAFPIILWVRTPDDATLAAFLAACNYLLAGVIASAIAYAWKLVDKFQMPRRSEIIEVYRSAWPLFLTFISTSLYSVTNTVILGIVKNSYQVGLFSAADKLRKAAVVPITPISTVFFPRISRAFEHDRIKTVRMIVALTALLAVGTAGISAILYIEAPSLIKVFTGHSFTGAIPVLRILSIIPFLVGLNTAFGTLAMINLGMSKQCSRIIIAGGLTNVALLPVLGSVYGARGAAISLVLTETLVTLLMGLALHRCGFLREAAAAIRRPNPEYLR